MVQQLLRDFPSCRDLFEYEDYQAAPTRGNASEFITRAIEDHYESFAKRENYVDYIANRPHVQKLGAHGLFNGGQKPLVLSQVADEVAHHPGVVWLPIISLRREDAARLNYDNAQNWKELITRSAPEISKAMGIPLNQFRWYAAFHDEGHHPHLHMVCYSADAKSGFLTRQGIADIKSMLAKEIFQQDLIAIYQRQTQRRDELTKEAGKTMEQLITEMQTGSLDDQRIEQLMTELAQRLRGRSGKKQYGYLPPALKSIVDKIVTELEKDPRISAAYDLWYREREEVLRTYKDDLPQRLPLAKQKEFKHIKNIVIKEAVRLGELVPPGVKDRTELVSGPADDARSNTLWSRRYRAARQLLYGDESSPPDLDAALGLLLEEANAGNPLAMANLGRIYADGLGRNADPEQAQEWYTKALTAFLEAEKVQPDPYTQYRIGKLYRDGLGCAADADRAEWYFRQAFTGFQVLAQRAQDDKLQYRIGWMLLHGVGTDPDEAAALPWLGKSADCGNTFAKYALGKLLLCGETIPRNVDRALELLIEFAEAGNQYAQYTLGKAYLLGQDIPQDQTEAVHWLKLSADQGNQYAQYFLDRFYGSIFSSATTLLYHMGNIFREQRQPPSSGMQVAVDSKLKQRIREKKIAMGHKPDDHVDQEQQMQ